MPLITGTRLGPYEILSALGAGGMGEVYRARDTRLDRTVAIKILPETLAADPQFRERFDREARAVSQLDHPNICTLYDVGEQAGTAYLVMQYLEGETLQDRLVKGALPLDHALKTAIEIASALDKAHRAGIVHRDLKPGNIMLTKTGAKLLDFGLAKASAPVVAGAGLSMLPTTPANLTAQGTILGTFQYMAPEQLEGHEADARTDIWAFGAVLYEILTGKKAFDGKSQASLIGAIMHPEPTPILTFQPLTPPTLDHIVKRCLAKAPDERWQTASDLMRELQWVSAAGALPLVPTPVGPTGKSQQRWWMLAAATATVVATGLGVWSLWRPSAPTDVVRLEMSAPDKELLSPQTFGAGILSVSPDGRRLAFVTGPTGTQSRRLWIRSLDSGIAQPLPGTEGAGQPFWSPDSRFVAFVSSTISNNDWQLRKSDVLGGPPITLADLGNAANRGAWSSQGVILITGADGRLYRVPDSGGQLTPVTELSKGQPAPGFTAVTERHIWPVFLSDGRRFLFLASNDTDPSKDTVYLASLDAPATQMPLITVRSSLEYSPGYVFYQRGGTLMVQVLDEKAGRLKGSPVPLIEHVFYVPGNGRAAVSVSSAGVLMYVDAGAFFTPQSQLTWFDRSGRRLETLGAAAEQSHVELSPDGTHVAVTLLDRSTKRTDLWMYDVARGVPSRVTSDSTQTQLMAWSPDGSRVVFDAVRRGRRDLFMRDATGAGSDELLRSDDQGKYPVSWSPDSRFIAYVSFGSKGRQLWVLPLFGDRKPIPFQPTTFDVGYPRFSPNDRWIAYYSNESNRNEIYVAPFPGPGAKVLVSTAGGSFPRWRRDGKELYYLSPGNKLMAAAVNGEGPVFKVDAVHPLFDMRPVGGDYEYDVSPDGQRFLVNTPIAEAPTAPIMVVLNWPALLKK